MIQTIPLIQVPDAGQNRFNQSVKNTVDQLAGIPFINGNFLQSVSLATGNNVIDHGLGRKFISFFIANPQAPETVYNSTPVTMNTALQLQLTASGAITIDLWVF